MLHEPTRRLWTEPDSSSQNEGWNKSGSKLETPGDWTGVFDDDIGAESEEYTSYHPKLPIE